MLEYELGTLEVHTTAMHTHTRARAHTHTRTRAHTHTQTHTHTHTHKHIHTHTTNSTYTYVSYTDFHKLNLVQKAIKNRSTYYNRTLS